MLKDIRDSKCISNIVFECLQKGQEAKQPKQGLLQQSKDHAQSSMDSSIPTLSLDEISGACELTSGDRNIFPIVAYVLSAQYWPEFPEEHIKLPSSLAESFNYFKGCFEKIKSKRTVKWLHRIGYVDIDIELSCPENEGDMQSQSKRSRVVHNLEVTPLQAVILHLFTHHSRWTLRQLAQVI
ncbi:unnamed protein product [Protopolystoma xenopodis]|uniref:Cullin family profile domain-containing protein n=1 Tax=Protopolystoma xenopodis TaxID=117903 RepID=A0A448X5W7_9PLAT|nr:unnamed protein product [Protopolystoma xenopodis]